MAATSTPRRGQRTTHRRSSKASDSPESLDVDEVEVRIEDLASSNESINWMFYGPSGHGKTSLAGHCPRATFLSTEKGVVAAKRTGSKARLIRAKDWESVVAGKKLADSQLKPGDWLILDSLTKMQVLMMRWILRMEKLKYPNRDLDIPQIQNHQKWQNYFKRFVDELIDAPYNCIFICTTMLTEDEDLETAVLPAITGKGTEVCDYIRAQMDIVMYYAITNRTPDGEPVRRALFQPYPPYVAAKDRYGVFGRFQDVQDGEYSAMAEFIAMLDEAG